MTMTQTWPIWPLETPRLSLELIVYPGANVLPLCQAALYAGDVVGRSVPTVGAAMADAVKASVAATLAAIAGTPSRRKKLFTNGFLSLTYLLRTNTGPSCGLGHARM